MKTKMQKNIGIEVNKPKTSCNDINCPFHGNLKIHGKLFFGNIVKKGMQKTATMEFVRHSYIPKYERYEKRKTKIKVHNPPCIDAKVGDQVQVIETRPISKTKNFVIINLVKK